MNIAPQFSIFMVNKPGILAKALGEFAAKRINIVAMTMMDSAEHGVMRVIFDDGERAKEVLSEMNMPFNQTDVLMVTLTNKSGALATIVEKLSKNHINISYAYCTAGARGGKTTGVLKVADVKKAMKILENAEKKMSKDAKAVRRPNAARA